MASSNDAERLDGQSFLNVLTNNEKIPERTLFWRTPEAIAVRQGEWKLLENQTNGASLYNLQEDISEKQGPESTISSKV